jgi:hypothetical protein
MSGVPDWGMPKRISNAKKRKKKRQSEPDVNQLAYRLVQESTSEPEPETMTKTQISQLMSEMGRRGGKIGGKRRLETMTPEKRSQIALKAARARWANRGKSK